MHTEGPWCFEAENGRAHPRVYGADNSLIAEVGNANLMRWEVWDHDARLIAAAPELLQVLIDLHAHCVAEDQYMRAAEFVIRKATEPRP